MSGALHAACRADDIGLLLERSRQSNCDLNERDTSGDTALHVSAYLGNARAVLALLYLGADVSLKNRSHGLTALHISFYRTHLHVSLILIKAGALSSTYKPVGLPRVARSVESLEDDDGNTPQRALSLVLSRRQGQSACYERLTMYTSGKSDIALGVPLPRAKYVIETPRLVNGLGGCNVGSVVAAPHSSGAVTSNGVAYTWGHGGRWGRLGHGSTASLPLPTAVPLLGVRVHVLAGGENHMLALCRDIGAVFSWGCNSFGQLGYHVQEESTSYQPRKIDFFSEYCDRSCCAVVVSRIAAGTNHSLAVIDKRCGSMSERWTSELYSWGCNEAGQLGLGIGVRTAVSGRGSVWCPSAVRFPRSDQAAASKHICALSAAGDNTVVVVKTTVNTRGVCASLTGDLSLESVCVSNTEICQWGNGVQAPFGINVHSAEGTLNASGKKSSDSAPSLTTSTSGSGQDVMCLCTSRYLSLLVWKSGRTQVWSVPECNSSSSKPIIVRGPDIIYPLEPSRLGLGRYVTSAGFSTGALVCSLCTGEVVHISLHLDKKGGRGSVSIGSGDVVVARNYAGVTNVVAVEDRVFVLSRELVPALPHAGHCTVEPFIHGSRSSVNEIETSDSEESRESDDDYTLEGGAMLSLQQLCENDLSRRISVKSVGGVVAAAQYLRRTELLSFCNEFVLSNLDSILAHGNVHEMFILLEDIEAEVAPHFDSAAGGFCAERVGSAHKAKSIVKANKVLHHKQSTAINISGPSDVIKSKLGELQRDKIGIDENSNCGVSENIKSAAFTVVDNPLQDQWKQTVAAKKTNRAHAASEVISDATTTTTVYKRSEKIASTAEPERAFTYPRLPVCDRGCRLVEEESTAYSGPKPVNLLDCFDAALKAKRSVSSSVAWAGSTTRESVQSTSKVSEPPQLSEIQMQDMQDYEESVLWSTGRAGGTNKRISYKTKNKSRWHVASRQRAESLSDVMSLQAAQEQSLLEQRTEEMETLAAIRAVEAFKAQEIKKLGTPRKGRRHGKRRTTSL